MPTTELILGVIYVFSIGVAWHLANKATQAANEMNTNALKELRRVTQCALILRGLNPHVVDPERFGPTGMLREDEEKQTQGQQPPQQGKAERADESEDERLLREAEERFYRNADLMSARAGEPPV